MGHLADIAGRRDTSEANTEAQNKTPSEELSAIRRGSPGTRADNDKRGTDKHAPTSAKIVVGVASEEDGGYGSNVVHGKDDAGARVCNHPGFDVSAQAYYSDN